MIKKIGLIMVIFLLVSCGGNSADPNTNLQLTVVALQQTVSSQNGTTAVVTTQPTAVATSVQENATEIIPAEATDVPATMAVKSTPHSVPTVVIDPNAPTFYVATDGNDESGNGSAETPWATITHALDSVADGSLILVREGVYTGRIRIRGQFANNVTVRSEIPYRAQLRADETVLTIFEAQGIKIEGFDIAHASAAAEPLVIQIQDGMGDAPGGAEFTQRITLRNNILHDSYNNDILKINNGAEHINIIGNIFYNQGDSDEHIDINSVRDVVIEDNIFMSAFAESGRPIATESSSFIVVKDSNQDEDGVVGVDGLTIRRNIFMHYQGSVGHNMVLLGEDGNEYFEADNVLIENNLFLGDGGQIRAPFGTKGVHNVVFRHNTITGDMPSGAFFWRSNVEGDNQPNDAISIYNNIFSDPTGTMENFATAPEGETAQFILANNVYWNGGQPLPESAEEMVNISDDAHAITADPLLNPPVNVTLPVWNVERGEFGGGSADITTAFRQLVQLYAVPQAGSAAIDHADPSQMSSEDILGHPRSGSADIGAYQRQGDEQAIALPTAAAQPVTPSENGDTPQPTAETTTNNSNTVTESTAKPTMTLPAGGGWVTFAIQKGETNRIYRLAIAPNAVPEDITAKLESVAHGQESEWLNISKNGDWYILSTDRFDPECNGWPCLVITQDFATFETIKSDGSAVHAEFSTISNDGNLIVFKMGGGTHGRDIWAIRREGAAWSKAIALTASSPYQEHQLPSLSADGSKVVFDCGDDPYSIATTNLCEVNTDGSNFHLLLSPDAHGTAGLSSAALHHASYSADGSVVFEANWNGETLWRLLPGGTEHVAIGNFGNDNSPCVLPDGTIISLWLQRAENTQGNHEIKLMSADGSQYTMLFTGQDVFDIGFGCGQ